MICDRCIYYSKSKRLCEWLNIASIEDDYCEYFIRKDKPTKKEIEQLIDLIRRP
jgi:hypothetical protein